MAVVKNNYIKAKPGNPEKKQAKAAIRYIQNRKSILGKSHRQLFSRGEAIDRIEAYRMIDGAEKGSIFFRFIISPDPEKEDKPRDLSLREVTEKTMQTLEEILHGYVKWVAAEHNDHTDKRHVHAMAIVPRRLTRDEFKSLSFVLRDGATKECLEQRVELDRILERKNFKEREEEEWEIGY